MLIGPHKGSYLFLCKVLDKERHFLLYYQGQVHVPGFFELLKILTLLDTYDNIH